MDTHCYMYWKETVPCCWQVVSEIRATLLTPDEARRNGASYARFLRHLDTEGYIYRPTTVRVVPDSTDYHCWGVTILGQPVIEILNWTGGKDSADHMIKSLCYYAPGPNNTFDRLGGPPFTPDEKDAYSYVFWTRSDSQHPRQALDRRRQPKYTRLWAVVEQSLAAHQTAVVPLRFIAAGDPVSLAERLGPDPLG